LPDLADQIAQMASEVALELQQVCPPASPSDQAAFDRCRRSLFGDSALRRNLAPRLLWGRRNQDAGAALKDTKLTQLAPDVIAGLSKRADVAGRHVLITRAFRRSGEQAQST
jgi:hypothetical protein